MAVTNQCPKCREDFSPANFLLHRPRCLATAQPAVVDEATPRPLSILEAIPHYPATDEELNDYARGIIEKTYSTPNSVGHLLARIREDNARLDAQAAGMEAVIEAATLARNRLLQDSGDQESIDKLNRALAAVERLRGEA